MNNKDIEHESQAKPIQTLDFHCDEPRSCALPLHQLDEQTDSNYHAWSYILDRWQGPCQLERENGGERIVVPPNGGSTNIPWIARVRQ